MHPKIETANTYDLSAVGALAAALTLCSLTFAADLVLPTGTAAGVLYVLPVLMTIWIPGPFATLALSLTAVVLTVLGYFLSPLGGEPWQILLNRVLIVGAVVAIAGVVLLRKRAEVAHHDERKFGEIVDTIPGVVWIMDPGYSIVYLNAYVRALTGLRADEDLNTRWVELIHPDDLPAMWAVVEDVFDSVRPFEVEFRLATAAGGYTDILARGRPYFSHDGELLGYIATGLDVTDQKQTETELRDSEGFLSKAQELAAVGSWIWEPGTKEVQWSDQMFRIVGLERAPTGEGVALFAETIVHPEDRELFNEGWLDLLRTKAPKASNYRIVRPDGELRYVQAQCDVVLDSSGEIVRILGTTQDVTQQRSYERELRDSRDLLAKAEEVALVGSWTWRVGSKCAKWSDGMFALTGRDPSQWSPTVGNIYRDVIHPDDLEKFRADRADVRSGKDMVSEFRVVRADGRICWVRELRVLEYGSDGEVWQVVGATRDVTDERAADRGTSQSRERLAYAEYVARLGHSEWDVSSDTEVWSDGLFRLFGLEPGECEPTRDGFSERLVHESDRDRLIARRRLIAAGSAEPGATYRIRRKDGVERDLQITGQVFKDSEGRVDRVFATALDVTELREAERALRSSEQRFELAARGANDGLWDWPDTSVGRLWLSPRLYELLGYEADGFDPSAENFLAMVHPDEVEGLVHAIAALLEGRQRYDIECRMRTKSGAYRWYRSRGAATAITDAAAQRMAGSLQDIDARHTAELELEHQRKQLRQLAAQLALVAEKERRRIGSELHDRTIQNLGLTKVKLGALRSVAGNAATSTQYDELAALVDTTIQDARALLSEISPPVLTELGFEAAVDWLAEKAEGQYGLQCTVSDDGEPRTLDDDAQLVLFQAVRELLANVGKHARAGSAHVQISGGMSEVVVCVQDDGIGFAVDDVQDHAIDEGGYGLFSIRERLRMLGGVVQIESCPETGTRVTVSVPIRH